MQWLRREQGGGARRVVMVGLVLGALLGVGAAVTWAHNGGAPAAVETVRWDRWESVDARTVRVFAVGYHSASCYRAEPAVRYSDEAVRVTLRFRRLNGFCTLEGATGGQPITIVLKEDLGGRVLVDGG